jgi:hypothetical protein
MFETENSAFVTLAQVAREGNSDAARILRGLVNKPTAVRLALLEQVTTEFRAAGVDPKVVRALKLLSSDALAERLRQVLDSAHAG